MFRTAPRHCRHAAIERLTDLVVGGDVASQDWDIENADATRIEAFLDAYVRMTWTVDERLALMRLIVASCDDALRAGDHPPAIERIRDALARDYAIHFHTVLYWACIDDDDDNDDIADGDDDDDDHSFAITPMMRDIYAACTPPLVLAALAGDVTGLDAALAAAPTQGMLDDALLGAAGRASPEAVRRLLAAGASAQTRDEGGDTPLIRAAACNQPESTDILLAAGSEIDAVNPFGWTATHIAALNGSLAALRVLLGAGANVHTRDDNGYDPLMAATECGHPAALDLLLAHGARIEATNRRGEHALAIARRHAGYTPPGDNANLVLATLRAAAKSRP